MKFLIYMFIFYWVTDFSNETDASLPEDIKKQMFEYALKLDQIRKSFETGKFNAVTNVKRLGGVNPKNGNVDVVKKVAKLGTVKKIQKIGKITTSRVPTDPVHQVKDQVKDAQNALESLMKKLDQNGFILAQTLLSLDLMNLQNLLDMKTIDLNQVPDLINKLDESRKQVEEHLENS